MITFRFHGYLQELLVRTLRRKEIVRYPAERRTSIKDAIEALGPPHTEVGALEVNGSRVDFSYLLRDRDAVEIYPLQPPVEVLVPTFLRPEPLPAFRFLVDANVSRLAGLLRMAGLDTACAPETDDRELAAAARDQGRILLSRDRLLLKRKAVVFGHLVREEQPYRQLAEVIWFYGLAAHLHPFSRCLRCNGVLEPVAKEEVLPDLEPLTRKYYDAFHRCPDCNRIFWAGSHRQKMEAILEQALEIGRGMGLATRLREKSRNKPAGA